MKSFILLLYSLFIFNTASADTGHFGLIKRGELNLYRPKIVGAPVLKGLQIRPLFARTPSGEVFFIEMGGAQKLWIGYFFASDGELQRTIMVPTNTKVTLPGRIALPYSVFVDSESRFGCYDNSKRLNFFDANGEFNSSLLMPLSLSSSRISDAVYNHDKLVLAARNIQTSYPEISVIDPNKSPLSCLSIPLCEDLYSQALEKGAYACAFIDPLVNFISTGEVVFNLSISPEVYFVNNDGSIIAEKTIPEHFRSFVNAGDFDETWFSYDSNGCISNATEEWFKTWTHSYPIYEYSDNHLVVPRVLYPTFYLDLYSYSDKDIEYLGYASTDKEFLVADTSGVYLLESKNDTSIVVGRYELVLPNYREERGIGWATTQLSPEQVAGIRRVIPDTTDSDTCKPCDKEKRRPTGYCSSIDTIKLVSADSVEYSLYNSLIPDTNHIIVFGSPQECALYNLFNAALDYVKNNPGFDLTIVFTHPFPEELRMVAKLAKIDWDYPILTNLDYKRLYPILKSQVCFLVVGKDGTITASADYPTDYPGFVPKPR